MIDFLITSITCQIVLFALYKLLLEQSKMHRFNRFYLLFTLVFSFVVPFVTIEIETENIAQAPTRVFEMLPVSVGPTAVQTASEFDFWPAIFVVIYALGFLFFAFRFVKNLIRLKSNITTNENINRNNATFVLQKTPTLPHTFLHYIFVNADDFKNGLESELFTHEITHAHQKHSIDILVIEFVKTIFWFNPILVLYKKAIRLNHEFLADEAVVANHDRISYQELLLSKAHHKSQFALASSFNFSITKKRMIMMTTTTSPFVKAAKKVCAALTFTALLACFACERTSAQIAPPPPPPPAFEIPRDTIKTATYYSGTTFHTTNADGTTETKRFAELTKSQVKLLPPPPPRTANDNSPYPEVLEWYLDKKGTRVLKTATIPKIAEANESATNTEQASYPGGITKFFEFYAKEFKMPAEAKSAKANGRIFLSFAVETDGSITNVKVLKGQSKYGINDEAIRVMKLSPKWIPAKENGKVVRSEFSLPVSYR